jgi:hypothetical protein
MRFFAYVAKFYAAAKGKVTTYVAIGTAIVTEIAGNWDATAAILPPFVVSHKAEIFALAALIPVWTRIRREIAGT